MVLNLGNFQSLKKASNPSIQIPDKATGQDIFDLLFRPTGGIKLFFTSIY